MIANPKCERCSSVLVWIGIGPGADPACLNRCPPVIPGTRCPKCKSFDIEDYSVDGFYVAVPDRHCIACGAVFWKRDAL